MKKSSFKADALLLLAAAIWGFAFVAQRMGMEHVGPFTFNAVRFALGSLALVPFVLARRGRKDPTVGSSTSENQTPGRPACAPDERPALLRAGGLAGCVLFIAVSLQQTGIVYTTAGRAGFITGLYVVIVPILGIFFRQRPGLLAWVGALCATAGMYLLSVTGGLEVSLGDSLVLIGAFFWAVHVMVIGWFIFRTDPLRLALAQSVVCSALSLIAALLVEAIDLDRIRSALLPIIYAGVLSVGVAYTLQVISQRKAHPGHVVIILSMEAVFAALGGWIILSEVIPARGLVGCGLMLAGAVVSKLGYRDEFTGLKPGPPRIATRTRS